MDVLYQERHTAFQVMVKPIGPICNLNCTYCYYLEKENIYGKKSRDEYTMPPDILEEFIRQQIEQQTVPVISFVWQGGEPTLLGIDYYERAVEMQQKYAKNKTIENAFQTNGTFITDEWCRFFKKHDFLVGISIDGPKDLHDHYRVTKSGAGTFDTVMEGIKLLKRYDIRFNTLTVVNDYNVDYPLEIYHFLKKIGSGFMQFIPIVERIAKDDPKDSLKLVAPKYEGDAIVSEWSVDPVKYGNFLCEIFDQWVQTDVGRYYVQHFDVALANWVGEMPGLCVFSETCGEATAIEHNGDLYACDHFVYPDYYLGNIRDISLAKMIKQPRQVKFGIDKFDSLPEQCKKCPVRFACNGGCLKNRISVTPDGEAGLNYLCAGYKKFFNHIAPYMDFMAKELKHKRPPANVMHWIRSQKAEEAQKKVKARKALKAEQTKQKKANTKIDFSRTKKNDLCPCGSGKLYKNCCRNKPK